MRIGSTIRRGWVRLGRVEVTLSVAARRRLKWMDYYRDCGNNARLTCRHFDISPQTFYRWRRRYDPRDLSRLESRPRCPRRLRQPTWSVELERAVLQMRRAYPRWGKDKLAVLLRRRGATLAVSMVGRILTRFKRRGLLVEPVSNTFSARKPAPPRPYAIRKPRDYVPHLSAKDSLIIGKTAVVTAPIKAASIIVAGKVSGDISASQRIELQASARVLGNLTAPVLVVQDGAMFEGHCVIRPRGGTDLWLYASTNVLGVGRGVAAVAGARAWPISHTERGRAHLVGLARVRQGPGRRYGRARRRRHRRGRARQRRNRGDGSLWRRYSGAGLLDRRRPSRFRRPSAE